MSDLIPDEALGEDMPAASAEHDLIPDSAIAEEPPKDEKKPEEKRLVDASSAAGKYTKGAMLGNVHQTLAAVPVENPILHPIEAARKSWEALKAIPDQLSSAAKTGMKWIADPVRAAEPYTRMDPETAGFATGPMVAQTAVPLFGSLGHVNEALAGVRGVAGATGRAAASGLERMGIGGAEDWRALRTPQEPVQAGPRSVGAAEASPLAPFAESSPELQQAAAEHVARGGTFIPEARDRQIAADQLGIRLSEGQASGDPEIISQEINQRGVNGMTQVVKDQTDALKGHFDKVAEETMPDVHTTTLEQHGNTLKEEYQKHADAADAEINNAYQQLRDAYAEKGGEIKIDPKTLFDQTVSYLKSQMQYERAVKLPEFTELENAANAGDMNFEQYELHRSNLAKVMRGNDEADRSVAYTMRKAAEQVPLVGETAELKPLADRARSLAKAKFDAIEADPAYEAAIKDKLSGEQFVRKYVTGQNVDPRNLAKMRARFGDAPVAQQTITRTAFDALRGAAGVEAGGTGKFKFASFDRAYKGMEGKADQLFDPTTRKNLENMRTTGRAIYQLPEGNYVNHSNTFVSMMRDAADHGLTGLAYAKGGPLLGQAVEWAKGPIKNWSAKRAAEKATEPLAGAKTNLALNTSSVEKKP